MTEGLKTIEGNIASIDLEKRAIVLEDRDGIIFYSVSYLQNFDQKVQKLKVGYYVKPTVEVKGETTGRLIEMPYAERPADWPKKGGKGSGGKPYAPQNEKPIIFESVFKSCCDQATPEDFQNQTYEEKMDRIWQVAKKISLEVIQLSGA